MRSRVRTLRSRSSSSASYSSQAIEGHAQPLRSRLAREVREVRAHPAGLAQLVGEVRVRARCGAGEHGDRVALPGGGDGAGGEDGEGAGDLQAQLLADLAPGRVLGALAARPVPAARQGPALRVRVGVAHREHTARAVGMVQQHLPPEGPRPAHPPPQSLHAVAGAQKTGEKWGSARHGASLSAAMHLPGPSARR